MKVDNFAITNFQTCPARYFLRIRQGWVPIRRRAALGFGGVVHAGIATYYREAGATEHRAAAAVQSVIDNWPENMPVDDFRTREKAIEVIVNYAREYPAENFLIIGAPENPLVEQAFTIDTGMFVECQECFMYAGPDDWREGKCSNCGQELEPILYGGILDAGIDFGGKAYVFEHKTTTQLGSTYFHQFRPNNQVTGYHWALSKLTSMKVGGALINAIGIYKAQATRFERHITNRFAIDIERWLGEIRYWCNKIKECERTGQWPMVSGSCTLYGLCDYHNVHVLSDETEQGKRLEIEYARSEWNYEARDD